MTAHEHGGALTAPGPFDPSDVTWTPVSGRLATARLTSAGIVLVIALVAAVLPAALSGLAWL